MVEARDRSFSFSSKAPRAAAAQFFGEKPILRVSTDSFSTLIMNLQAVSVGTVFLVAAFVLFLLDVTTPKNERVPVRPWFSHSHASVRLSVVVLSVAGFVLIAAGLIV